MTTPSHSLHSATPTKGFTLIEVVLAIGIFLLSILALVGLLGPTLSSVEDVTQADEVTSVVNTVNAFLMNSPDIAPGGSRFNAVYNALQTGHNGVLTIFVFRQFEDSNSDRELLRVGFSSAVNIPGIEADAVVSNFSNAAGPIYRVLLSASSVTPEDYRDDAGANPLVYPRYTLNEILANYPEGYLAMEVRIFAEPSQPAPLLTSTPAAFVNRQPIFTYNMAIVR
jgi:Tfp pilus assembly protein PilV